MGVCVELLLRGIVGSVGAKIVGLFLRSTMTLAAVFCERGHHPLLWASAGVWERKCLFRVVVQRKQPLRHFCHLYARNHDHCLDIAWYCSCTQAG